MARLAKTGIPVTIIHWGRFSSDSFVSAEMRNKAGETVVLNVDVSFGSSHMTVTVPGSYINEENLPGVVSISVDNVVIRNEYVSLEVKSVASQDYIDTKIDELTKVMVLGPLDVVPPETPSGTVVVRRET